LKHNEYIDDIAKHWDKIVLEPLSYRSRPIRCSGHTLFVEADDSITREEIAVLSPAIYNRIQELFKIKIKQLLFV